jgi:sensor domain CHASE-containing protein/GAF domain-containing protein
MNLRRRVFSIILIATAVMLVVLLGLTILLVYTNSAEIDNRLSTENSTRVERVVQDELSKLNANAKSWGYWSEANNFVKTKDQEFVDANLSDEALASAGFQIVIYLDGNRNVLFSRYIDPQTGQGNPVPTGLMQYLFTNQALFQQNVPTDDISGIISLSEGPFLVSSIKTLNGDLSGPSNGFLVVSKPLDQQTLSDVGFVTGLKIERFAFNAANNPQDILTAKAALDSGAPLYLSQLGGGDAAVYIKYNDIQDQPAVILKITFPSTVFSQTLNILRFLVPALLLIALGYGLTISRLMNRYVVNPLTILDSDLENISQTSEPGQRVQETGDKEIRSLSISINDLLSASEVSAADLKRSFNQLQIISDINRSISGFLEPGKLLNEVVELLRSRLALYYVGIFLLDDNKEFAVLRAGTGEAGEKMLAQGHKLSVGGVSMIGWSTANQKSRIALDVGKDAIRFSNPLLPETRSELAIPVISRNVTVGALTLQSSRESAFNENDILAFQGIADSLSVALENAALYQSTQENLDEIRALNRVYVQRSWGLEVQPDKTLNYTYEEKGSEAKGEVTNVVQIPLLLRDQILGEITLEINRDSISPEDQAVIEAIADQTAQALENVRLLQETQDRAAREEKINEFVLKFTGAGTIDEIMKIAVQEIGGLSSVSEVTVHLTPEQKSFNYEVNQIEPAPQETTE